jgi:hypothetical protein
MKLLYDAYGASVFSANGDGHSPSAYDAAVAGNSIASLIWLEQNHVLPSIDDYSKKPASKAGLLHCRLGFIAAAHGAFEALEYIADRVPGLRTSTLSTEYVDIENEPVTYSGLLVLCAHAARLKGRDCSATEAHLESHLLSGGKVIWRDLAIALESGELEAAKLMLRAGARIDLDVLFDDLRSRYPDPAAVLAALADQIEDSGKGFEQVCEPMDVVEPNRERVTVDTMKELIASENGFQCVINDAAIVVRKIGDDLGVGAGSETMSNLSREMVRFLRSIDPRFVGPSLLRAAVSNQSDAMITELLQTVDPNQYPIEDVRQAHPFSDWTRELPVHACIGPAALRQLFDAGANVNLPLRDGEENLLYMMCEARAFSKLRSDEMFDAFSQCGGDFACSFNGQSAASLAKKAGADVYARFMSAKAAGAVLQSLDNRAEGGLAQRPKDRGPTAL